MAPSRILEVQAALSRYRVVLGGIAIAVVAVIAWRWVARGESTPVAPRAAATATSAQERPLEITVLGVHDVVAAAPTAPPQPPVEPPQPPVVVPTPAVAPASAEPPPTPPPAPVAPPPRASSAPRSASRAQSSAAKASPPVAAKPVPAQEPRVEIAPAKPQPKPDGPPLEANPYVYK